MVSEKLPLLMENVQARCTGYMYFRRDRAPSLQRKPERIVDGCVIRALGRHLQDKRSELAVHHVIRGAVAEGEIEFEDVGVGGRQLQPDIVSRLAAADSVGVASRQSLLGGTDSSSPKT